MDSGAGERFFCKSHLHFKLVHLHISCLKLTNHDIVSMSIQSLWVYPVKSCAGVQVSTATCTDLGLLYDRRFMVCHATSARLLSQRQLPRMALITVSMDADVIAGIVPGDNATLTLSAPDMPPLTVPLHPPAQLDPDAITTCTVWEWKGPAFDVGKEASEWLTTFLGRPARLVRYLGAGGQQHGTIDIPPRTGDHPQVDSLGALRPTDPSWAPGAATAFADGFPLLLTTTASLRDLNARGNTSILMNRFRSNVVVDGELAAWEEDQWKVVQIGELTLENVKPCGRCTVCR